MAVWVSSSAGPVSYAVSLRDPVEQQPGSEPIGGFLVSTVQEPVLPVSGARYLAALRQRAASALERTLARLPEVQAILWASVDTTIRVVSVLSERSDEAILRVADGELGLMDEMAGFRFEFRTCAPERMDAFLAAGYMLVIERHSYDNSGAA